MTASMDACGSDLPGLGLGVLKIPFSLTICLALLAIKFDAPNSDSIFLSDQLLGTIVNIWSFLLLDAVE